MRYGNELFCLKDFPSYGVSLRQDKNSLDCRYIFKKWPCIRERKSTLFLAKLWSFYNLLLDCPFDGIEV